MTTKSSARNCSESIFAGDFDASTDGQSAVGRERLELADRVRPARGEPDIALPRLVQ